MNEVTKNPAQSGLSELENIFQEYKSKLERAEKEADEIINAAWQKAEEIIADKNNEAQKIIDGAKQKAKKEADQILFEANTKADEIEKEATGKYRKDAKEKTKKEVEKIIAETQQAAEKHSSKIIADAKEEAKKMVENAEESARSQIFEKSETIINEAQEKAKKIDEDSIARVTDLSKMMVEIVQKTEDTLHKFQEEVCSEITGLTTQLDKARSDLELNGTLSRIGYDANESEISGDNGHLKKWRELNILPPYDINQINKLLTVLKQTPNVKLDGKSGTETSYSIYLNIVKPIPLPSILQNLSFVESSEDIGEAIMIRLKQGQ